MGRKGDIGAYSFFLSEKRKGGGRRIVRWEGDSGCRPYLFPSKKRRRGEGEGGGSIIISLENLRKGGGRTSPIYSEEEGEKGKKSGRSLPLLGKRKRISRALIGEGEGKEGRGTLSSSA